MTKDDPTIQMPSFTEPMVYAVAIDEDPVAVPVQSDNHQVPVVAPTGSEPSPSSAPPQETVTPTPTRGGNSSLVECECLFCGDTRIRRVVPGNNYYLSLCGDTHIDMRICTLPPGSHVKLFVMRVCGDTRVLVPKQTRVSVRRILLCGDKDVQLEEEPNEEAALPHHEQLPRVTIYVVMLCGSIRVRSEGLVNEEDW